VVKGACQEGIGLWSKPGHKEVVADVVPLACNLLGACVGRVGVCVIAGKYCIGIEGWVGMVPQQR
jgi:hypothetical protein